MDNELKSKIESDLGCQFSSEDYDFGLWHPPRSAYLTIRVATKQRDAFGNHVIPTDDEIEQIISDLKDLSDWRHYKRLKHKLNE